MRTAPEHLKTRVRIARAGGTIHKERMHRGGGGVAQKADIIREVAWIYSYRASQNADKGGEGVQNPEYFADVLYVWSPSSVVMYMHATTYPGVAEL